MSLPLIETGLLVKLTNEMASAESKYGKQNSPHEVVGVLQIELMEMMAEIHARCHGKARGEALQIAAVALRFVANQTQLEEKGVI